MPDSLENRALHQKTDPNQSNNCGIKKKKKNTKCLPHVDAHWRWLKMHLR